MEVHRNIEFTLLHFAQNVSMMHLMCLALGMNLVALFMSLSFSLHGLLTQNSFIPIAARQGTLFTIGSSSGLEVMPCMSRLC